VGAGALAVVPAAQADSLGSARTHIRAADAALHQVVAAAAGGSVSGPLAELEKQLRAAGHDSAKLYRSAHHAHTTAISVRAATAMSKLAAQQNRDTTQLTPLVGALGGLDQSDLAGFIAAATQGREQALSLVSQLIGQLPAPLQSTVAGIVAQLSNAGTDQVGQLAGSISPGSIACPAIDTVSQVVATVLTSVQADLARVQSLLSFLPAGALTEFTSVVNGLPAQLTSLVASLKQAFNCTTPTPATGVSGATGPGSGPAAVVGSLITSVTDLVQSLLGSFLPGISAGQTPSPVATTGPVSGLLGQVTSLIPGLGGLLGGGAGGGLLGGLLGGFGH
jgi:hypothetical protein